MFSIIQPLFLQKTKPLYPYPKYLFGIGIWIWAAKNYGFSLCVSVVRAMDAKKYHHRNFQQVRIGVNANFKSDLIYVNLTISFWLLIM